MEPIRIRRIKPSFKMEIPLDRNTINNRARKLKPVGDPAVADRWGNRSWVKRIERTRKDFPPGTPLETPCVLWQGAVDHGGYGRITTTKGGTVKAKTFTIHRYIVELVEQRRLKPHQIVMHRCDNPPCYRYDHLVVGTIKANHEDMLAKGRNKLPPLTRKRGEEHGQAKLTWKKVHDIRAMLAMGFGVSEVARTFGMSHPVISKIKNGKAWIDEQAPDTDHNS